MAVNINTVYLRVLAIANKEQRGYITPQEFNTLANQAQLDIFEQYFYDLNQFLRLPGNDTIHADPVDMLEEKIEKFSIVNAPATNADLDVLQVYRLGAVFARVSIDNTTQTIEAQHMSHSELRQYLNSPLTAPTKTRPLYTIQSNSIVMYGDGIIGTNINYIKKPVDVYWGYTMINDEALYNPTASINFELHAAEETELVLKILSLAGVVIRDPQLYQIAATEEAKNIQQEKQ
jgi:hypothetical protein